MQGDTDDCPLRHKWAFTPMTDEEVRFTRSLRRGTQDVPPRQDVLVEGEPSKFLYTVLRGVGLRYKTVDGRGRQVIGFTFPGDFVGLQGGLMGEMGHSFISTTQMTLRVFDRADIVRIYETQPERAYDLTWLVATEENFLGEMLATVGQRPASQSMAWLMLRLFLRGRSLDMTVEERPAGDGSGGGSMSLPYRQQDLADALGLSLVHTNKTLAKLRAAGLATWIDGMMRIPDLERLAKAAGTDVARATPGPRPLF